MNVVWKDHTKSTSNVLRGKPHIQGTRIPEAQ